MDMTNLSIADRERLVHIGNLLTHDKFEGDILQFIKDKLVSHFGDGVGEVHFMDGLQDNIGFTFSEDGRVYRFYLSLHQKPKIAQSFHIPFTRLNSDVTAN